VILGGVRVTCDEALAAVAVLKASRASAIRSVLAAAGSPLKDCDYWAVAGLHIDCARAALAPGSGIGPKGRHLAKDAFARSVACAVAAASKLAAIDGCRAALAAMREDERYAAAMAADAVELQRRAHENAARARVRLAVTAAVTACSARPASLARCGLSAACGTGQCPFAPAELRGCPVPASPGRTLRPPAHVRAGAGFSEQQAAAWLAAQDPWKPAVHVAGRDNADGWDDVAA
jgi:hypothetical protein